MELLKELLQLNEAYRNDQGEIEYTSFDSWKRACKKANPEVWFDGDRDICNAFVGTKPYKRHETRGIGEWDGAVGYVVAGKSKNVKKEETKVEEALGVTPQTEAVLAKICQGIGKLGIECKADDVRAVFVGGSSRGMKKLVTKLEAAGFDSAGAWEENKEFFKKIGLQRTDYKQLVKASL